MKTCTPALRLYLLGSFHLERDAQTIHLSTRKVESLFAFLVLHPEAHPREKLAALLWGDSTDEHAQRSLRTALATIRKELGDDVLLADRETVQLDPGLAIWVDAREISDFKFQNLDWDSLQSTICNLKSEINLLPDFYDDWILPERERLRAIYLDALLQIAQAHRAKSEYANAIELVQKILAHDPANEKAYQHLIFCLAATGDRIGALKQFEACEKKLRDELNVAPSRETVALCAQIQAEITGGQAREALLTNLPAPLTSFVGREKEKREIREMMEGTRLLTLIGAGGCGKTRLAIQVGIELAAAQCFKHGVWWVDLSALQDPAHVAHAIATVFDLHESENLPLPALLTNYLRAKDLLLILDNCEQVIVACAQIVGALLPVCPRLHVLATSRERINVSGESVWYVPSLAVPPTRLPLDQLRQYDAIQLFSDRARAVAPHWSLLGNDAAVTNICARLDGIPLAIELAATRLNVLSAEQINARLGDRFALLTGGSRAELPRHQTLRATMDWSYDLLSDAERAIFRQFGVFAGGWTLEAAEQIISPNALDYLTALADKSLIVVEQKDSATRYRFLETIRQYAREKLEIANELRETQARHLDYFLNLAKQAEPGLHGAEQFQWLDRLDLDHDNIRAALEWSLEENTDKGLDLVWALIAFWEFRAYWSEGKEWADKLLTHATVRNLAYANGLLVAGKLGINLGDWKTSQQYLEKLVILARELGEAGKLPLALGLGYLGSIVFSHNAQMGESMVEEGLTIARTINVQWVTARVLEYQADLFGGKRDQPAAQRSFEESLAIYQSMGDQRNAAYMMGRIGRALFMQYDCAAARRYVESSQRVACETQDRQSIMSNLNVLSNINQYEGKYDLAKQCCNAGLEMARELGAMQYIILFSLSLAFIALDEGEYDQAKSLFVASLELAHKLNFETLVVGGLMGLGGLLVAETKALPAAKISAFFQKFIESGDIRTLGPVGYIRYDRYLARARSQLDDATFNAAWEEGQKMTYEQAVECALENLKNI